MSIGINDAMNRIGKKSLVVLREPSLGPVFGIKGGATGGGYSDTLLKDSEDRIISEHILETIFGKQFYIDVKCKEIERECEEDILSFDYHYSLYMQGFPNNLKEIKEKLFGKEKVLIK